jgi:TP901 family phage tail tape measure protein
MATQRLAKVVITANASTAKKVLEEIDALVQKYTADIQKMTAAGQANTAECKQAERTLKALSQVQRDNIEDTKRLGEVVQDLTNTKLRDLRRALGSGKAALAKLTGSDADLKRAELIRSEMKQVGDEIRLIEGQYVKIPDGLKNIKNQSDQWLDKAIKQQRDLVGSLEKSDASYQQNLATLKQLEAEEDRRKGKMSVLEARQTVSNGYASASDLRRAKATLTEKRDNTPTKYYDEIGDYNRELQEIEKRLEAVSGKTQKASMSWKQMKQVLAEPNKASGEDIKRTMEVIQQKIQQLPAGSKYVADLRRQYSMLEQTLKGTRMSQSALNDILTRSKQGKASLDELRRAYKQLEEELNQINTKSKEFADKQKSMKELKKNIDEVTGAANKQGGAWHTAMKNLTAYVGLFAAFNKAKELVTGAIKKNLEYSGSLTDIRKVSGLTKEEVKKLSTELAKIDTRTSVDGLAQLAYEASKLGVGKYGVEGMTQFVRAADKINVAIGEEMGEKALPSLLKMTEVMGLIPKMGLERSIEAVGSSMFKLASTSTATSSDITEFAKRCTGVARTAGITTDQLLALGSAFSAQMASPEVAATAMSKFIVALQKNHNLIEKDLAIPAGTINSMYQAGNAMDAIVLILEKMKEKGNMNALGEIFKDVGGDGQRLISSMVTMAKNVDMLKDHLYESQEAFEEATAVGKEYSMQQQSAIGILERANNLWEKAFVNPDGVDAVKGMAEWWYEMSATMTSSPLLKGTLQVALQMVLITLKAVATLLPVIIGYIASQGLYSGLTLLWQYLTALGVAVKSMFQYTRALFTANAAQSTLNKTMKLNPWIALASVVVGVAGAIYGYTQRAKEAAEAAKEAERQANAWKSTLGQAAVETSNLNQKLANYKRMMSEANLSQKERQGLISRFNRDFHSYISKLGIEVKSVKDLRDHYSELAQEAQRATYYRMMEQAKKKALPKLDADRDAAANALLAQIQKMGIDKFGASFTDIDRWVRKGANGNAIFWRLAKMMPESKSGLKKGLDWKLDKQGFVYRTSYDGTKAGLADSHMQYELRDLLSAARWYANSTGRRYKKEKDIEDNYHKWFPKGYTPYPEEDPGTLDNNAPENNATTGSGHNPNRDEKNIAKDRANALIANIKAFYEEQMRKYLEWVAQMNADGEKISEGQQKEQLDYLQSQMDRALGTARQSIANLGDGWKQFYSHMDEDVMVFDDETSKQLLESIGKADVGELHKLFTKLSGDLSRENNKTLAENLGALLDQIFANGSKELREAAEKLLARQREIQKILNEHDYTGAVDRNTRSNFDRLGFLQPAKDIRSDSPEGLEKMNTAFDKLTTKARESITVLYSLNPESEDFQNHFLQFLSVANEGFDFSVLKVQDLKALYLELIKYNDEFAAAEKKQYDDAKKITDFLWKRDKRNLDQQEKMRKMQNESKMFGKRTNLLSNLGLANLTADPEIELMKARMQAAENYYAFVERNNKNQQLLAEAERARQEAELAYVNQMATAMKSRLSQMKELVQPIEDFGAAVGQALAEMRYDAESANDAIKSALKSMLESWAKMALNDVNTQMWKAINDAGAKRGKKNAQPDIEAARANADANAVTMNTSDIGTAGNPAHVIVDNETKPSDSISDKKTDVVVHSEPGGPDALPTVAHKDSPMATSPILVPNNTERHGAGGLFKSVDPDTMPSYPSKDKVSAELPVKIKDDDVVDSRSNSQEKSDLQHESLSRVEEKRRGNFPSDFHPDLYPEITGNSKKESPVPTVDTKKYEPQANAALKRAHNNNNLQNEEHREGVVGLGDIQENVRGLLEVAKDLQSKVSDRTDSNVGSPAEQTEESDSSANSTSYFDPAHRTQKALPADAQESQGKVRKSPSNQKQGSPALKGVAEQAGGSFADAITGQSSFAEAGAGIVMGGVNAALNADLGDSRKKKKEEKQRKKQLREEKKHQKALSKEVKQGTKEREKTTDKGVKNMTVTTEQGNKEQSKGTEVAQQTMLGATDAALNATLVAKQKNNDATLQSDAVRTQGEVTFSIAGAMAKCFEFLGPIAGPIAAAVVMSTLMGLLQWALSSALGGGKKKNSTKGPNTKVVSGMLTYDSGNVQDLRPFVGNDGSLYWATEDDKPHNGVSLLTQPTATTINGRPSLVAENGPELVIGRETTQAMMMNNPQLLKALVNYDRNYSGRRAYDTGNIAETSPTIAAGTSVTDEMVSYQANTNVALLQAVNTLLQRLEQPIEAKIDMYGRGKLYDSMTKANQFMKNK